MTLDSAKHLDANERARYSLTLAPEIAAEGQGLRLVDDKLHERGGIEIDHRN